MVSTGFLYGSLIFVTALTGGLIPLAIPNARENHLKLFVSLGAGLLLGMAFMHMLPEASRLLPEGFGFWVFCGFALLMVLERFIMVHACEEHGCDYHTIGVAAFAGLTIHGLIEGFALASTFYISNLAPLILIAILAHKIPAGFALTSILKLADRGSKQIVLFVTGVALSAPLGIWLASLLLRQQSFPAAGILLSISAGTFLYIGACDLLPELHRGNIDKFRRLAFFFAGVAISYASDYLLGPHG
jgi:zinc and cadmium transporter